MANIIKALGLNTKQAAVKLGVSERRVRKLIGDGRLPSTVVNNAHFIQESDIKKFKPMRRGRQAGTKFGSYKKRAVPADGQTAQSA